MKRIGVFLLALLLAATTAYAAITYPLENRTAAPMFEWALDSVNGLITITGDGAIDRQQMPSVQAISCTFQAKSTNLGNVYLGGPTVTNALGLNEGIHIVPGGSISNWTVNGNSNKIWVAGDSAGDIIKYHCN